MLDILPKQNERKNPKNQRVKDALFSFVQVLSFFHANPDVFPQKSSFFNFLGNSRSSELLSR